MSIVVVALAILASSGGTPIVCKGASCRSYDGTSICKGTICKPYNGASERQRGAISARIGAAVSCPSAYVVDGDTLRCRRDRIRLLGIDAPELERCPSWRICAPGDGQQSKRSLIAAGKFGPISYQPVTHDRYGRTVAVVRAGNVNLSCWQLQHGQAIYKPKWDTGQFIARECRQ